MAKFDLKFTRRRYSNRTYTWVSVRSGDQWYSLGDPWPCVVPARKEVLRAIRATLEANGLPLTGSGDTTGNWTRVEGFHTINLEIS